MYYGAIDKEELRSKILLAQDLDYTQKSVLLELLGTGRRYGLVWEEKPEAAHDLLREKLPVLLEVPERRLEGAGPESPNHVLIEGDNLHALTLLQYTHAGKVDVVYIDPPYNTGNKDFRYNDTFVDREDQWRHSKWLSFLGKRLRLARKLLKETGVIFISIDDNELGQLRLLCDNIFGEGSFVNTLAVKRRTKGLMSQFKDVKSLNQAFEYVLVYRKSDQWSYVDPVKEAREKRKEGYWNAFENTADRPTMRYRIGNVEIQQGQWKWSEERGLRAYQNYLDFLATDHTGDLKRYYFEHRDEYRERTGQELEFVRPTKRSAQYWTRPSETVVIDTDWMDFYVNDDTARRKYGFETAKHPALIEKILAVAGGKSAVVLDFFAGSGTTLQAALSLNAKDGGKRQCILITNNENQICERVAYERCRAVIRGEKRIQGPNDEYYFNNSLRYYRIAFVERDASLQNRRQLAHLSTDLLCLKEEGYLCRRDLGRIGCKVFATPHFLLFLVLEPESIPSVVQTIAQQKKPCKVYVFSPDADPFAEDFEEVQDRVELCAWPEALYRACREALPEQSETCIEEIQSA